MCQGLTGVFCEHSEPLGRLSSAHCPTLYSAQDTITVCSELLFCLKLTSPLQPRTSEATALLSTAFALLKFFCLTHSLSSAFAFFIRVICL